MSLLFRKIYILLLFVLYFIMIFSCSRKYKTHQYIKTVGNYNYKVDYSDYLVPDTKYVLDNAVLSFSERFEFLNPYRAYTNSELFFQRAIFSSLFYIDPMTGKPIKNILKEYSVSSDGLKYYFTLLDNVKFCNGDRLTSEDVIASLSILNGILKSTDLYKNFYIFNDMLEFKQVSDTDFVIATDKPNGNLPYALSNFPIIPKKIITEYSKTSDNFINFWSILNYKEFIGSGPYLIKKIDETQAVLEKNPYYFKTDLSNNKLPYSNKIIVKFFVDKNKEIFSFINNETDILFLQPEYYRDLNDYYSMPKSSKVKFIDTNPSIDKVIIAYNSYSDSSKSYLKEVYFREYLSFYLNSFLMKQSNMLLTYNFADFKPSMNLKNNDLFVDINNDGILEFKDGNPIFLRVIISEEDARMVKIIEKIIKSLRELKFDVKLEVLPYHIFIERLFTTKDYDLAFFYYSFYPGVKSYISLLNDKNLSFSPYVSDDNKTYIEIRNQLQTCVNTTNLNQQLEEINKLKEIFKSVYQLYPIMLQNTNYIIKDNIYNFKINSSVEKSYNLKTIETIIKIKKK